MEDEPQVSESMVSDTSAASSSSDAAAAASSSVSALSSSLLAAAPIAAAAAAAASSTAIASAPSASTSLRAARRRPAKFRDTQLGEFFKPAAQRVETWNRRKQKAKARGKASKRAKLKPTTLADFFTPVAQCVDSWGPEKRAAQRMANDADTAAELSSVHKDSLQSIRLNELRVCFQLNNASLGLPYVPTELLQIVNKYCAPRQRFRRVVAVAVSKDWNDLWLCSEAQFREMTRKEVLGKYEIDTFMRWRATAWATWDERIEAPLVASPEIKPSRKHSDDYTFEQICAETRRILSKEAEVASSRACKLSPNGESDSELPSSPAQLTDDPIPRSWDLAFCTAFACWRPYGYFDQRWMQYLLSGKSDELEERMQAADPHCDIEELSRLLDEYGSRDSDEPRFQSRCVFVDERQCVKSMRTRPLATEGLRGLGSFLSTSLHPWFRR